MAKKISKWKKFKRFLKRNMTPTWARHFSYQVFALLTSVAMIVGVADYAVTKSYDERKLSLWMILLLLRTRALMIPK